MRRAVCRRVCAALSLSIVGIASSGASGIVRNWTNSAGGNFNLPGNWSGGVPGSGDTANFNLSSAYAVTFDVSPTNTSLTQSAGTVTFRSDTVTPRTYTLSSGATLNGGSLTIAAPVSGSNTLTLNLNASALNIQSSALTVAAGNDLTSVGNVSLTSPTLANANLTLSGANSEFTQSGASTLTLGAATGGTSAVNVGTTSGTATTTFSTGTGDITVGATGQINLGGSTISQTGTFNANGALTLAGGTVNITRGTFNAARDVTVDGGTFTRTSDGTFNLAIGHAFTAKNNAQVTFSGLYRLGEDTDFNIQSGADVLITGGLFFVDGSSNDLNVAGVGSTLTCQDTSILGGGGGIANFTLSNGATANFQNGLFFPNPFNPATFASINVQSGAKLNVSGGLSLQVGVGSGNFAGLTLTGANSAVILSGPSQLNVGAASGNTAVINVGFTGGTATTAFTTGTGDINVNANGQIKIGAFSPGENGTFNANGVLAINGGTVNINNGTLNAAENVTVDGGTLTRESDGTFSLAAGKTLTARNNAQVSFKGFYNIGQGCAFNIQSGADFSTSRFLDVGNGSNGTLNVDGAGSTVTTSTNPPTWGGGGGMGTVTLSNGSNVTVETLLVLAGTSSAGTGALVNVQSGATMNVSGDLLMASNGGSGVSATVTLSGANSAFTQSGTSTLTLGAATGGASAINVGTTSGTATTHFTTGTGDINVNASGQINVGGGGVSQNGTFNANGPLNINGGAVNLLRGAFNAADALTIKGGGAFNVLGGTFNGDVFPSQVFKVISGTVNVTGPASTANIETGVWGDDGATATVSISNGAVVNVENFLHIGDIVEPGTTVAVNVLAGAKLNLAAVFMGRTNGSANLSLSGADSAITQLDFASFFLGANTSNTATITVAEGKLTLGFMTLGNSGRINVNGGIVDIQGLERNGGFINYTAGALRFGGGFTLGTGQVFNTNTLTLSTGNSIAVTGAANVPAGTTLNLTGGTLSVGSLTSSGGTVNLTSGTLRVLESAPGLSTGHPSGDNAFVSHVTSLNMSASATLDLANNDLIIDYTGSSPILDIENLVRAGYHGGDFLGTGITTSIGEIDNSFILAVADNAALAAPFGTANGGTLFSGVDVDLTSVLVKFTNRVDLNLDGVVTPADATIFGTNFDPGQPAVWATGDLDYDGVYTPNDATIFGTFYDPTLASLPEPASFAVLGMLAVGLARRGRRPLIAMSS